MRSLLRLPALFLLTLLTTLQSCFSPEQKNSTVDQYSAADSSIIEKWRFINDWFVKNHDKIYDSKKFSAGQFAAPATEKEIEEVEAKLKEPLPAELKKILLLHNGEVFNSGSSPFFGQQLVNTKEMIGQIEFSQSDDAKSLSASIEGSYPEGTVKKIYFHSKWVPVFHDGAGNYVGIDLDPDRSGNKGQVIIYGPDVYTNLRVAGSLQEFFDRIIQEIKKGDQNILLDKRYHIHERFKLFADSK